MCKNNLGYLIGESMEITVQPNGLRTNMNYFNMVLIGQTIEDLNKNKNKANKEKLE